ncbi:MAG TPA: alpha/beta hydrolase [Caulobacteraceae bacterium]|nr:alpha/beta hydrolase [Caulobacteraceae bacterium]
MTGAARTDVTEHKVRTGRHTSAYLAAGPEDGPLIIFVHGWPELSISWRHQLPVFAGLGFRAIAPDMRGYGRSSVYSRHEDYQLRESVQDMLELLEATGREKAIFVGHDWGAPVVWSLASHHPDRCHGVANLCVPYIKEGFAPANIIPLVDRRIYPEADFPAGQWDYQLYYEESFPDAVKAFEANISNTVRMMFRKGDPSGAGQPTLLSMIRRNKGWFTPFGGQAPDLPRDEDVLTEQDLATYVEGLSRNGMFGPDSWYMNAALNTAYAREAKNGGRIDLPVLFLHAAYDYVCETIQSDLPKPMRRDCSDLTERLVKSGHWMAQEQPAAVNAAVTQWIGLKLPGIRPSGVGGLDMTLA